MPHPRRVSSAWKSTVDHLIYVAAVGAWSDDGSGVGILGLDPQTLEVKRTIAVGKNLPFGLALNRTTQKLYATNTTSGAVSVYDVGSGRELAVVRRPGDKASLRQVVVDETTNTVYASVVGGFSEEGKPAPKSEVWVIDGNTDTFKQSIVDPVHGATGLAVDSKGKRLYVSGLANNEVAVIDLNTLEVARRFPTGAGKVFRHGVPESEQKPESDTINIELDPARNRLFAINQASGTVTVLDATDGKLLRTISTGAGALSARLHPRTGELYVANRGDGTVSVIDGQSYYVTAHLPTGTHPQTIAIDPDSGRVFVSNKAKGKDWSAKDAPQPFEPGGDTVTVIRP